MPMLKSISGHTPVSGAGHIFIYLYEGSKGAGKELSKELGGIEGYLGRNDRALGTDLFNFMPWVKEDEWARVMDETREDRGNGKSVGKRRAVTYQHFIISPDPTDSISLEQLRLLVARWVEENFTDDRIEVDPITGDARVVGFGVYQAAAVYHDDNENGILHSHVIVNNTDVISGRRLQISNKRNAFLATSLQSMAREMGLGFFDNQVESDGSRAPYMQDKKPTTQRRLRTKAEREARAKGERLWKDDITNCITIACNLARTGTIEEFRERLEALGVKTEFRKDGTDFMYFHPDGGARKVSGARLGRLWTVDGVRDQMRLSHYRRLLSEDVNAEGIELLVKSIRSVHVKDDVDLNDITRAFMAIDYDKIETIEDARKKLASHKRAVETGRGDAGVLRAHRYAIGNIESLLRIADKTDILPERNEDSATKTSRANDRQRKVALQEKVDKGWRLTKEEYAKLTISQRAAWRHNKMVNSTPYATRRRNQSRTANNNRNETKPPRGNWQDGGDRNNQRR